MVVGGKDRTILVYLDPKKLEARHLSMLDVVKALKDGNMMVTPGIAYFGNNQILLDTNMMVDEGRGAERPAHPHRAGQQRLPAQTSATPRTPTPSRLRASASTASRQVYVPIYRQQGASSLAVANGVKDHSCKYIEDRCPPGHQAQVRDGSVDLRQGGHPKPDPRRRDRRRPGVDHDPDLPGQLAHDADRQHVDPAGASWARSSACMSPATRSTP